MTISIRWLGNSTQLQTALHCGGNRSFYRSLHSPHRIDFCKGTIAAITTVSIHHWINGEYDGICSPVHPILSLPSNFPGTSGHHGRPFRPHLPSALPIVTARRQLAAATAQFRQTRSQRCAARPMLRSNVSTCGAVPLGVHHGKTWIKWDLDGS